MNSDEKNLIDGLFSRLQEAERQSAPRDGEAEAQIGQHLARQPAAPYYMAQAMLIQEAAIKRLDQRVRELEAQQQQQPKQSSGGFLAGLFGAPQEQRAPAQRPGGWGETRFSNNLSTPSAAQQAAPAAQGGGFMRGALQTAAGVAGGVMVADLLTSMFHHDQPQEIVEVIHEQAPTDDLANVDGDYPAADDFAGDSFDGGSDFFDDDSMFS